MKKLTIFLMIICSSFINAQVQNTLEKPATDERVELLSIVFRLAESEEYNSEIFKLYTDRINNHYTQYKDHKLIKFIKKLREENAVGYDAVMKMAVHLDEDLNPKIPFSAKIPDNRWGEENAYKFVSLLQDFYKKSDSEIFFRKNKALYAQASERFLPIYKKLDLDWYTHFYGKEPNEKFIIINGLGNGGGNYGPTVNLPNKENEVYAIMGAWNTDSEGMVEFPAKNYFPTLLHEFNHSFVNEPLGENYDTFRYSGEIIFEVVKKEMKNGAYGSWETMLNEALVRAAVIKYMKDHDFSDEEISLEISEQLNRGFIWIEDLVEQLEFYDKNRSDYPTLESFLPKLAEAYIGFTENISKYLNKTKKNKPRFVSITEFENGSQNVDPDIEYISLNFDRSFTGSNFIKPGHNKANFPNFKNLSFSEDRKTVILHWTLEPDKEYEFILIALSPDNPENKVNEDYTIQFKTKN